MMGSHSGQQPIFLLNGAPDFSAAPKPEIIVELKRSKQVVQKLLAEGQPVAVDCEGVNLGAKGRLTLLQMGTIRREVYLFDVGTTKDIVIMGGLKELLQSTAIIKVMHSCQGDSAALYHQFGVLLQNVFDTQAANMVIQSYGQHVRFPKYLKLDDLVKKYGGTPNAAKALQETWKYQHEYWALRPLTPEMVEYAAGDVTVLLPGVYANIISEIQDQGLWGQLLIHVDEMIHEQIQPDRVRNQRSRRRHLTLTLVLTELELQWCGIVPPLNKLTSDQTYALWLIGAEEDNYSPVIRQLRSNLVSNMISEAFHSVQEDARKYLVCMTPQIENRIKFLSKNGPPEIQEQATIILDKLEEEKVQRAVEKLKRGHMLASWEKFLLLKYPTEGVRNPPELESSKCILVRNFERTIVDRLERSPKNVKNLRETEKGFLQLVPSKFITSYTILQARDILLSEQNRSSD